MATPTVTAQRASSPSLKAAGLAASVLRARIEDGVLAPGQRLIESELMAEIAVARSTLREAFLILEAEGLVELRHQRGAVVRQFTRADMRELFEVRACLEGRAAGLACARAELPVHRRWLRAARAEWCGEAVLANELTHMERNVPLHEGLIAMSGNARLARLLRPLAIPGYRLPFLRLLDGAARARSAREHVAIIDAVLAAKAARAEQLMRAHVARAGALAETIPGLR
jgi:DNA-binding GntR family transcriptional regulator